MFHLEDFRHIVPDKTLADIYTRARKFYGRHIVHLNATYQGGGVAEILYSLVMLLNDVGIDAGWRILHGSQDFFEITKGFHNALQGAKLNLSERKKRVYVQTNEVFAHFTHLDHDCVIVHDPQPLALIQSYRKRQPWVWRCHIDLTDPHKGLWDFLKGFLLKYDLAIVSNERYMKKDLPVEQRLIYPAINPLSPKNVPMSEKAVRDRLAKAGVPTDKPILCLAVTEAMWKGTPVVASNIGGIPSQITDGENGFLLEPLDFPGFADRIVHLLHHPKEGQALGQRARETVREKFLITRLLADHLDVLDAVMA